jgi:hypothetical protein
VKKEIILGWIRIKKLNIMYMFHVLNQYIEDIDSFQPDFKKGTISKKKAEGRDEQNGIT